ncbi:MAG: DNA polymerase III subunit beta [Proteobacteria bacterium]|nr:DNA polymerase III subunit beta [Pseudomonadota bacterium]
MKLTIERADLLRSLGHVQSVVERRNTIPILSNVKIDAADGTVALNATDMDLDIVETVTAVVTSSGATTVHALTLYEIVRKLPDGAQIELESQGDGKLFLRSGRARIEFPVLPTEDFPILSSGKYAHNFKISAADLRGMIDRTRFAISTEETRYYLNGIYLHVAERDKTKVLRAVSTDGHRLASVEVALPKGAAGMPGVIVPRKTVQEIRKLIDETGDDVEISLSDAKIRFAFDDAVLTSKLIDGTFPDYQRVIPAGNDKVMKVDCKAFANKVDLVSAISSEKSRAVKLRLSNGSLALSASNAESGAAEEELDVDYDSGELEIGFNSAYLLDIARQIDGGTAVFNMNDAASPTIIRDAEDDNALYVLMPMRV